MLVRLGLQQEPGPFIKDWYGLYKQRVLMDSPKKVVVMDLGSFSCKCAALHRRNCTVKTSCIESVVAEVRVSPAREKEGHYL